MLHRLLAPRSHDVLSHEFVRLLEFCLSQFLHHINGCIFLSKVDSLDLFVHTDGRIADDANDAGGGLADEVADTFSEALLHINS